MQHLRNELDDVTVRKNDLENLNFTYLNKNKKLNNELSSEIEKRQLLADEVNSILSINRKKIVDLKKHMRFFV